MAGREPADTCRPSPGHSSFLTLQHFSLRKNGPTSGVADMGDRRHPSETIRGQRLSGVPKVEAPWCPRNHPLRARPKNRLEAAEQVPGDPLTTFHREGWPPFRKTA